MKSLLFALLLVVIAPSTFASQCDEALDQRSMNECAFKQSQQQDVALHNVYEHLSTKLTDHQRDLLKKTETAWLAYRESACRFAASGSEGGTSYGQWLSICSREMTQTRIRELEGLSHCNAGDGECPTPAE
ncbi:lysozyme inhibitor LprI family protein [Paraburkholderia caffeinilytica]|uniref:lysozyme inhibitor LprI family protein n=1 Tax=Paraburkholderia caffeinilytica TaxID=1761016 RepID=UPI0013BE9EF2|nr:lysozyme inhibitor LprI family protein [Paraburkholderia caffeinilytica]